MHSLIGDAPNLSRYVDFAVFHSGGDRRAAGISRGKDEAVRRAEMESRGGGRERGLHTKGINVREKRMGNPASPGSYESHQFLSFWCCSAASTMDSAVQLSGRLLSFEC